VNPKLLPSALGAACAQLAWGDSFAIDTAKEIPGSQHKERIMNILTTPAQQTGVAASPTAGVFASAGATVAGRRLRWWWV